MSLRVLVVEDSETLRALLQLALKKDLGAEVVTAHDGREGLEILRATKEPFDIILLDVNMPVMDGFEFLDHRRHDPALKAVPTVIMTTEAAAEDRNMAIDLGASGYLRKPFRGKDVITVVRSVVGKPAGGRQP